MKSTYWKGSYFWEKKTKSTAKKSNCEFIRINRSKEGYDANYETGRIQTFIIKFKNRQLRKVKKNQTRKSKKLRRRNKKIKTSIDVKSNHPIKTKCLKRIVKRKILPEY